MKAVVERHYKVKEIAFLLHLPPKTVIQKMKAGDFGDIYNLRTEEQPDWRIPVSGINGYLQRLSQVLPATPPYVGRELYGRKSSGGLQRVMKPVVEIHYTEKRIALLLLLPPEAVIQQLKAGHFGEVYNLRTEGRPDWRIPVSGIKSHLERLSQARRSAPASTRQRLHGRESSAVLERAMKALVETYCKAKEIAMALRSHPKTVIRKMKAGKFGQVCNLGSEKRPDWRIPVSGFSRYLQPPSHVRPTAPPGAGRVLNRLHSSALVELAMKGFVEEQLKVKHIALVLQSHPKTVIRKMKAGKFGQAYNFGTDERPDFRIPVSGLNRYLERLSHVFSTAHPGCRPSLYRKSSGP